jgi:hypothetical protein
MTKRVSETTYALSSSTAAADAAPEILNVVDVELTRIRNKLLERLAGAGRMRIKRAQATRLVKLVADDVALMEVALEKLEEADLLIAESPEAALTESEEAALGAGGFKHHATAGAATTAAAHAPHSRGKAEYARLISDAFSTEEAAATLGVNGSRIRQRLTDAPRTLYGIKCGREWRIPKFQFAGRAIVPGLDQVVAKLPGDVHPVAFYRWLRAPTPDLTLDDDETPVAPIDWLKLGHAPEPVAELASGL